MFLPLPAFFKVKGLVNRYPVDPGVELCFLPEIAELFEGLKNAHEGVREANVESAFPLDAAAVQAIVVDLEKKFSCKIQATVTVVPELIGGVRIAIDDEVIDASVRGKLAAMATALKN